MNGTAIRRWHMYIGLLTAPSLVFFCLTGAVQVFSLHEAHGDYHPYGFVEKLSSVHKDQVLEKGHHHDHDDDHDQGKQGSGGGEPSADKPDHDDHEDHEEHEESSSAATVGLKVFFLLTSLALATSGVLGVWIGVTQSREKRLCWILLGVGTILPVLLLLLE